MKVSIVMLVYNHEKFIRQALESILIQKVSFDYELIVGEDCSTDQSRTIIKEYEQKFNGRMKAIYRSKNVGTFQNLMDCFRNCKGKYVAFLEGDDYWSDEHKLQKTVEFLEENTQYSAVAHNYRIVDLSNKFIRYGLELDGIYEFDKKKLEKFKLPSQTSTLLIRNIISQIKKEDLIIILKYKWIPLDRIAAIVLLRFGKIAVLPDIMSTYRYYIEATGTNWTSKYDIAAKENYFFFYKLMCGIKKLSAEMKIPLDMMTAKVELLRKAIKARRWSNHKIRLYFQYINMILLERHKIRLMKAIIKSLTTSR